MAVKIRLRSQGTTNHVTYRLVVTDSRSPRDGKYLEAVGWYDPYAAKDDDKVSLKLDRIQHWIDQGAQMSDCTESLVKMAAPAITRALQEKRVKAAQKRRKKK
ncbi:MAG: 30S ribosomal protein S16 [Verrucomicrobia bacterium]|nr:30S ribosomal protein S16 [Verrucomicrobiota bacterium]